MRIMIKEENKQMAIIMMRIDDIKMMMIEIREGQKEAEKFLEEFSPPTDVYQKDTEGSGEEQVPSPGGKIPIIFHQNLLLLWIPAASVCACKSSVLARIFTVNGELLLELTWLKRPLSQWQCF